MRGEMMTGPGKEIRMREMREEDEKEGVRNRKEEERRGRKG